jgi:alkylated DNA repair dioxygenase AlkB
MTLQPSLFGTLEDTFPDIPGLRYVPDILSLQEQTDALNAIDRSEWSHVYKRRRQHYGYRYDVKGRRLDASMSIGELPPFGLRVAHRLRELQLMDQLPDQMLINEYLPGQGISAHTDREHSFTNRVVSVSLGWPYEMDFIRMTDGWEETILLGCGSALVLADEARYDWQHRIKARKSDRGIPRRRRVSMTFRNVML